VKAYQVTDAQLNAEQRRHLNGVVFPLLSELKRIARERLAARADQGASHG
jgi:hypothetical protein